MGDSIGSFHPQVVHFAIVLLIVGVVFRLLSLTGRLAFTGPAASVLLLLGTASAVAAAETGISPWPGGAGSRSRDAVVEHEDWGKRARNVFLAVAALEILALVLARRGKARPVHLLSGVVGIARTLLPLRGERAWRGARCSPTREAWAFDPASPRT